MNKKYIFNKPKAKPCDYNQHFVVLKLSYATRLLFV